MDAPSYVVRPADSDVLQALLRGEFVYVLDSRQKGKTSLMSRVVRDLEARGVATVHIDLQRVGSNLTVEQWYAALVNQIGRQLGIQRELFAFWSDHTAFGPLARFLSSLQEVVLPAVAGRRLVIFIDEIDFVRSLPFSVDEFFSGLRDAFNRRTLEPEFEALSFCLVGSATPSQLVSDVTTTPFNIGRGVVLNDFTLEDVVAYENAFPPGCDGRAIVRRVMHWTGGHPFLTQAVCAAVLEDPQALSPAGVDAKVKALYLTAEARQREPNLMDVSRRLLESRVPGIAPAESRSQLLHAYEQVLRGNRLLADDSEWHLAALRLCGAVKQEDGVLVPRNRIYRTVFGPKWIRANLPDAELRRQRAAARKATVTTSLIAILVIAGLGGIAANNARLAGAIEVQRDEARYEAYCSNMVMCTLFWQDGYWQGIKDVIDEQASNPARGWEWSYWKHLATEGVLFDGKPALDWGKPALDWRWSRDGSEVIARTSEEILRFDSGSRALLGRIEAPISEKETRMAMARELPGGRILDIQWGGTLTVYDKATGRMLWRDHAQPFLWRAEATLSQNGRYFTGSNPSGLFVYDLEARKIRVRQAEKGAQYMRPSFGAEDRTIAVISDTDRGTEARLIDQATLSIVRRFPYSGFLDTVSLSPDGTLLAQGTRDGMLRILNLKTERPIFDEKITEARPWRMAWTPDSRRLSVGALDGIAYLLEGNEAGFRLFGRVRGVTDGFLNPQRPLVLAPYNACRMLGLSEISQEIPLPSDSLPIIDTSTRTLVVAQSAQPLRRYSLDVRRYSLDEAVPRAIEGEALPNVNPQLDSTVAAFFVSESGRIDSLDATGEVRLSVPQTLLPKPPAAVVRLGSGWLFRVVGGGCYRLDEVGAIHAIPMSSQPTEMWPLPDGDVVVGLIRGQLIRIDPVGRTKWRLDAFVPQTVHGGTVYDEGRKLAVAGAGGTVAIVDLERGKVVQTFSQHAGMAVFAAVSPDGRRLASCGDDNVVRIWDMETSRLLTVLEGHTGEVNVLVWLDGGATLVSISRGRECIRWRTTPYPR